MRSLGLIGVLCMSEVLRVLRVGLSAGITRGRWERRIVKTEGSTDGAVVESARAEDRRGATIPAVYGEQ